MKVLLTGANGYLGKGVLKALSQTNNRIVATSRRFDTFIDNVTYRAANLFEIDDPYDFFDAPDVLLHLAWTDGFVHMSMSHLENLFKHMEFINCLISKGIKKVCVMGSVHEVGFYEGSVDENTPCKPQSFYGISKNALRQTVELLCDKNGIIFQWIRGYYIVGNDTSGSSIFSKIAKAEIEGKKSFPFTLGLNQFDFLDYDVFCDYIVRIVNQNKINGVINCCSGRPEKLSDRVEKFIKDNKYSIKLDYGKFPDRPYDSKAIWGDNTKLLKIING